MAQSQVRRVGQTAEVVGNSLYEHLRIGDEEGAEALLNDICFGLDTSYKAFHHSLINFFSWYGDTASAVWVAARMERIGLQSNLVTYNSLLNACIGASDVRLALDVWDKIQERGLSPNNITFNAMMHLFSRVNNPDQGLVWMGRMREYGLRPGIASYGTLISAFAKADRLTDAMRLFRELEDEGIQPDIYIFNALLRTIVRADHVAEAVEVLQNMQKHCVVPDRKTLGILARMFIRLRLSTQFNRWLQEFSLDDPDANRTFFEEVLAALPDRVTEFAPATGASPSYFHLALATGNQTPDQGVREAGQGVIDGEGVHIRVTGGSSSSGARHICHYLVNEVVAAPEFAPAAGAASSYFQFALPTGNQTPDQGVREVSAGSAARGTVGCAAGSGARWSVSMERGRVPVEQAVCAADGRPMPAQQRMVATLEPATGFFESSSGSEPSDQDDQAGTTVGAARVMTWDPFAQDDAQADHPEDSSVHRSAITQAPMARNLHEAILRFPI